MASKKPTSVPAAEVLGSAMLLGSAKPPVKHVVQVNCRLFSLKCLGWRRFPAHKCHVFHTACSSGRLLALWEEGERLRLDSNLKLPSGNERGGDSWTIRVSFHPPCLSKAPHHGAFLTKCQRICYGHVSLFPLFPVGMCVWQQQLQIVFLIIAIAGRMFKLLVLGSTS